MTAKQKMKRNKIFSYFQNLGKTAVETVQFITQKQIQCPLITYLNFKLFKMKSMVSQILCNIPNLINFWAVGDNQGPFGQPLTSPRLGTPYLSHICMHDVIGLALLSIFKYYFIALNNTLLLKRFELI
jgi:hypothetical protein